MTIDYRAFRPWSPYLDDAPLEALTFGQIIGMTMRRYGSHVTDRTQPPGPALGAGYLRGTTFRIPVRDLPPSGGQDQALQIVALPTPRCIVHGWPQPCPSCARFAAYLARPEQ